MSNRDYKPLGLNKMQAGAGYHQPGSISSKSVGAESSALEVMTDLKLVQAATIDAQTHVDVANQAMIAHGVRSLLVTERGSPVVVGLVTARDILGERPMQVVQRQLMRHDEIRVVDIMTPAVNLEVLYLQDVLRAKVGQIVETLKLSGRQHALVVDVDAETGKQAIRGIFSASQIARQLGIALPPAEVPRTFAEIEAVIAGEPA